MTILWYNGCFMGFDVYQLISEHEKPGETVGYFAYLPNTGSGKIKIGTHRRDTLPAVKKEIQKIFREHRMEKSKGVRSTMRVSKYRGFDIYRLTLAPGKRDKKPKVRYVGFIPSIGMDNQWLGTHLRKNAEEVRAEIRLIIGQHDLCRNIIKVVENTRRRGHDHIPKKKDIKVKCKAPNSPFRNVKTKAKIAKKKIKRVKAKRKP